MVNKKDLRIWAKEERKKIDTIKISKLIVAKLKNTKEYLESNNIMIFYPKDYEIDLLSLLEDNSKNFYLPRIDGKNLLCCSFKKGDVLCESCYKTMEPFSNAIDASILDLIIVPALAVDEDNYRLGYGGGFYDRFLEKIDCTKIVCISKKLIITSVLPEKHDVKMDIIITD